MHCVTCLRTCQAPSVAHCQWLKQGLGRRTPFAFLEDIKQRFESAYGASAASAVAYEYNTEFSHTLQVHSA